MPYKMVLVSAASAVVLFLALAIFKKIFPKKEISKPVLLILISLLPLISMLRPGTYESGDLSIHVSFAIPFFESLKEGHFSPIWNSYVLRGYGYPLYLFVYPLPYYLASIVHLTGISFIDGFKLIAGLSFISSGYFMYLFIKEETKNKMAGFIAGVFYLFAPYHLIDLHFRFAIGEVLAFSFLPLSFYLIKKIVSSKIYFFIPVLSVSIGGLILSHQAISLVSIVLLGLYVLILFKKESDSRALVLRFTGLVGGLLLTSFYWIPLIFESKYTYILNGQIQFYSVLNFIFSPARYGFLFQGRYGELYFPIGYIHLIILFFSGYIFLIKKRREDQTLYYYSLLLFGIIFLLILPMSSDLWKAIPFLSGFQFSYRLSVFFAFFSSIIAGITIYKFKNKTAIYIILSFVILITILNWGNRRVIPQVNDQVIKQGLINTLDKVGPGRTIWVDTDNLPKRTGNITLLSGKAKINDVRRTSSYHEYEIVVVSDRATLRDNTIYFPNWFIDDNGEKSYFSGSNLRNGLLEFNLQKGRHIIKIGFEDTQIRKISRIISTISLCILFTFVLLMKKRKINL